MTTGVDAVIFDWGGTITPWHDIDALAQWLAVVGETATAQRLLEATDAVWARSRDEHRSATLDEVFALADVAHTAEMIEAYFEWWEPHTLADPDAVDVFTGLPETWRTGFPAGEFAQEPPDVPGAAVVAGLFEDTLPTFLAETDEAIAFMHVDCDLYSSTRTVLDLTSDRLVPDAVLVFDEFFNYPGWQQHEYRAWTEFVERTGRSFEYLAYTGNHEQVVVRLH